jgi:hypothetical protein
MFSVPHTTTKEVMHRLLHIQNHPRYENVTVETFTDTTPILHRQYHFTYTKDAFRWIPSFLLPEDFRRIKNDSYFDFDKNEVRFCVEPSKEKYYRVEGRVTLEQQDEEVLLQVNIDSTDFKYTPRWLQDRVSKFILQQIVQDLESMAR